ncbi:MAG: (d)CMP kinase [Candidatus Daviesbacteria bacterium]|nr:(d)CMP kinase [Candidatus Daviesbacteria bacterium]
MSNVITIDGTASSGKSTVGFLFAKKIGYQFIDSGLIYRVGVLLAKRKSINVEDGEKCAELLSKAKINFKMEEGKVKVAVGEEDVTSFLKTPETDKLVPIVAAHAVVRAATKEVQRSVGERQDTVMAGRDIGSEIFPEAKLKFFITASVRARAKRRYEQSVKNYPGIKLEDIEREIESRDQQDSTREASPMRIPENAIVIDTSDMNIEQVVEELHKQFKLNSV